MWGVTFPTLVPEMFRDTVHYMNVNYASLPFSTEIPENAHGLKNLTIFGINSRYVPLASSLFDCTLGQACPNPSI